MPGMVKVSRGRVKAGGTVGARERERERAKVRAEVGGGGGEGEDHGGYQGGYRPSPGPCESSVLLRTWSRRVHVVQPVPAFAWSVGRGELTQIMTRAQIGPRKGGAL